MTTVLGRAATSSVWGGERTGSISLFVSRGTATGISFLINLYLAKELGPTEYGTYAFAIGILTFIGIFFDFGYFAAAARLIASSDDELAHDYTGALYVYGVIFAVVFASLVFAMSRISDHVFQVKAGHILLAIAALSPAMIAPYLFEQMLKATGRLHLLGFWVIATKVFFALLLVWVVAGSRLTATSAAVTQMVGGIAAILIVVFAVPPYFHDLRFRLRDIRDEQARFGRPLYVGKIVNLGAYHTDKLLLAYFATAKEVGWYMLAMAIAGFVSMFAQSVAASGFRGFAGRRPIAPEMLRWNTLGIAASSLAIIAVASVVILGYLGADYRIVPVLLIPAVGATAFQGAYQPYNSWLMANGFGIEMRRLLFIVGTINLIANLLLIPTAGVYGAAIASVIGMAAYWYLAKRAYMAALQPPAGATVIQRTSALHDVARDIARKLLAPAHRADVARRVERTARSVTNGFAAVVAAPLRVLPDALIVAIRERLELRRQLDYAPSALQLLVTSDIERRTRVRSCRKEPETVEWLHRVLADGGVFYDIGANVGAYSLIAGRLLQGKGGVVYAFEPGYRTYSNLVDNVFFNGLSDVIVPMPLAANSETAVVDFGYSEMRAGSANHGGVNGKAVAVAHQNLVACTLDDAVAMFALRKPTSMKIDIDGGEAAVLRGASQLLADSTLKDVLIEMQQDPAAAAEIGDMLKAAGFCLLAEHRRGEGGAHNMIWSRK